MANHDNVGDTTKISIEEVNRKVDGYRTDFLRINGEIRQEFRAMRATMEGFNTRLWIIAGVIIAAVGLFNYYEDKPAMAMKTIAIYEARAEAQDERKEVTTSPIEFTGGYREASQ